MSQCLYCKKKIASSKVFCSNQCKENYFGLLAIQIPKPFLKKIFVFCTTEQRANEISQFALRHGWREDLLNMKIEELAREHGYTSNN